MAEARCWHLNMSTKVNEIIISATGTSGNQHAFPTGISGGS